MYFGVVVIIIYLARALRYKTCQCYDMNWSDVSAFPLFSQPPLCPRCGWIISHGSVVGTMSSSVSVRSLLRPTGCRVASLLKVILISWLQVSRYCVV